MTDPLDSKGPGGGLSFRALVGERTSQAKTAGKVAALGSPGDFQRLTKPAFNAVRYAMIVVGVVAVGFVALVTGLAALPQGVLGGAALGWLTGPLIPFLSRPVSEEAQMPVDERPARTVLFLGNGRISDRDLPRMVRYIADSEHSPIRYDLHMRAWGAATLKEHWRDAGDQELLRRRWDEVVIQPQSGSFEDEQSARDFHDYGTKLIAEAEKSGAHVDVMANWTRGADYFDYEPTNLFRSEPEKAASASKSYGARIERETHALAAQAGAGVVDLAAAFADATKAAPDVELLGDGNHVSAEGAYLAALVLYGDLAQADVANVSWRPDGVSEAAAARLRAVAARHLQQAGNLP